jgi:hypothetical protein
LAAIATPRSAREGLLKLTDMAAATSDSPDETAATLAGDDGDDTLMAAAGSQSFANAISGSNDVGGMARGGASSGSGWGGFGGIGDGGSAGAQAGATTGGSSLAALTPGPDAVTSDPSLLGVSPGGLSAAPEPAVWVSLILGFSLTGAMLRKRRQLT